MPSSLPPQMRALCSGAGAGAPHRFAALSTPPSAPSAPSARPAATPASASGQVLSLLRSPCRGAFMINADAKRQASSMSLLRSTKTREPRSERLSPRYSSSNRFVGGPFRLLSSTAADKVTSDSDAAVPSTETNTAPIPEALDDSLDISPILAETRVVNALNALTKMKRRDFSDAEYEAASTLYGFSPALLKKYVYLYLNSKLPYHAPSVPGQPQSVERVVPVARHVFIRSARYTPEEDLRILSYAAQRRIAAADIARIPRTLPNSNEPHPAFLDAISPVHRTTFTHNDVPLLELELELNGARRVLPPESPAALRAVLTAEDLRTRLIDLECGLYPGSIHRNWKMTDTEVCNVREGMAVVRMHRRRLADSGRDPDAFNVLADAAQWSKEYALSDALLRGVGAVVGDRWLNHTPIGTLVVLQDDVKIPGLEGIVKDVPVPKTMAAELEEFKWNIPKADRGREFWMAVLGYCNARIQPARAAAAAASSLSSGVLSSTSSDSDSASTADLQGLPGRTWQQCRKGWEERLWVKEEDYALKWLVGIATGLIRPTEHGGVGTLEPEFIDIVMGDNREELHDKVTRAVANVAAAQASVGPSPKLFQLVSRVGIVRGRTLKAMQFRWGMLSNDKKWEKLE
ncbi:hypothetical protein DFJ73DRAFT_848696 [Zopfochytrium polystomum]|nr:hypothetical protein DFJ73DRAFT_848696 [Zopfochytrium polystomum]